MQLITNKLKDKKKKQTIAQKLTMASCSLIAATSPVSAKTSLLDDIEVDAAIMYYGERDRVQAIEGITNVQKAFGDNSLLDVKLVWDALTGASASGAVAQNSAQTFTRPSGNGEYTINAGETPLDDTFRDARVQLSGNWTEILTSQWTISGGLYGSKEYDYTSFGANGGIELGLNKDNTTLSLSGSYTHDKLDPVGGKPVPLSTMAIRKDFANEDAFQTAFDQTRNGDSEKKDTGDMLLGITQILSQRWLMQANYGLSSVSGYLTDPYKILSIVDSNGNATKYRYEHRPDSRLKHSGFILAKGALSSGIVDFSYRYSTDDWDISSHTLETHYRHYFTPSFYGQLHLRYYLQDAANFYQPFLLEGASLPEYASADYRIGDMSAYTVGLKAGYKFTNGHKMTYRLEYYQQDPDNNGVELVGQLKDQDLFPSVKSVIFQVGYSF